MKTKSVDIIVTDLGVVRLGKQATAWIGERPPKKKKRASVQYKQRVRALEDAVNTIAHIRWHSGKVLEKF